MSFVFHVFVTYSMFTWSVTVHNKRIHVRFWWDLWNGNIVSVWLFTNVVCRLVVEEKVLKCYGKL
jgi:hypothetical protein